MTDMTAVMTDMTGVVSVMTAVMTDITGVVSVIVILWIMWLVIGMMCLTKLSRVAPESDPLRRAPHPTPLAPRPAGRAEGT